MTEPADGVKLAMSELANSTVVFASSDHMQRSGKSSLLSEFYEAVENRYTNNFLLRAFCKTLQG